MDEKYEVAAQMARNYIGGQLGAGSGQAIGYNPTIRENLENRIAEHKKCIVELERIKGAMPENLVDMKISDLRSAMQF